MKKKWLGYAALILLAISMAACEGAGTVKGPSAKQPPPREPLADTPDVKNARFEITGRSLSSMKQDGVPDSVTSGLEALKGQVFQNAAEFNKAVAGAIGADALATHRAAIMRYSTHVKLAVEPPFPGTDLSMAAAAAVAAAAEQPEGAIGTVFFDFDRSEIKAEFMAEIEAHAKTLMDNPSMKVKIEGHADERGTTEYNLALGERRANAVKDALVAIGVNQDQLETVSYGEERPAMQGSNEEAWAQNRRAVLVEI